MDALAIVTKEMLENTQQEQEYFLDILQATNRANVEVHIQHKINFLS